MSWRISTVSEETGVAPMTLRAWERRYGFPKPERTDSNYRTYSDDEVVKLRHVVALIAHGLSVSEAVAQMQREGKPSQIAPEDLRARFSAAAKQMDESALEDVLQIAVRELPPARACDEVMLPLLRDMAAELDVACEHVASRAVRSALVQLATLGKRHAKVRPVVLACPAGEEHEGGLLGIAVHLRLRGERVIVIGANTPTDALATACKRLKPSALCLTMIRHRSPEATARLLANIVERCRVPKVIVGGAFARDNLKHVYAAGAEYAEDATEVIEKLGEKRK